MNSRLRWRRLVASLAQGLGWRQVTVATGGNGDTHDGELVGGDQHPVGTSVKVRHFKVLIFYNSFDR